MTNTQRILPIHRRDLTSGIIDQILGMIGDGQWAPGERLPSQRMLAEQMDVSMASLREALHSLKAMGILEMRHGIGTFVSKHTKDPYDKIIELSLSLGGMDVEMFFEARGIIETGLAYLAAQHATETQIEALFKILEDQLVVFDTQDNDYFHDLDLAFHQLIAEMANNKFLSQINDALFKNLDQLFRVMPLTKEGWRLHENVAEAIRSRSPDQAYEAMRRLIGASSANYLPYMKKSLKQQPEAIY